MHGCICAHQLPLRPKSAAPQTWTMILEFNDTPEGLVVDIEVVAGLPFKGYDERAPLDGYAAAAGLNEMMTAPLIARQKGSYDWEESINAITRHTIEEFSNLQHFVPYLYEKHTIMGKAGLNWIPTLGTWMQYNKWSINDGNSISFYHMLVAMAKAQIDISKTPHGSLVEAAVGLMNHTFLAATQAAEAKNVLVSQKYVQPSNAVTKAAYETNKASGAHPEVDITVQSLTKEIVKSLTNGTMGPDGSGSVVPHVKATNAAVHTVLGLTGNNINLVSSSGNSSGNGSTAGSGMVHSFGKGLGKMIPTFNVHVVESNGSRSG